MKKNKRGDIPTVVLVIGVFAVSTLALITFYLADFRTSNSFVGLQVMQKLNAQVEEYTFYLNNGGTQSSLNDKFSIKQIDGKNYFYFEVPYSKSLFGGGNSKVPLFSVRYPVPS